MEAAGLMLEFRSASGAARGEVCTCGVSVGERAFLHLSKVKKDREGYGEKNPACGGTSDGEGSQRNPVPRLRIELRLTEPSP